MPPINAIIEVEPEIIGPQNGQRGPIFSLAGGDDIGGIAPGAVHILGIGRERRIRFWWRGANRHHQHRLAHLTLLVNSPSARQRGVIIVGGKIDMGV